MIGTLRNTAVTFTLLSLGLVPASAQTHYAVQDLAPGAVDSQANTLNDKGEAVGYFYDAQSTRHLARFNGDGTYVDLGAFGSDADLPGLNNGGTLVGYTGSDTGDNRALAFTLSDVPMFPAAPKRSSSYAVGIDDRNVGAENFSSDDGSTVGVLRFYPGCKMVKLPGTIFAEANGVGASGVVVGDDQPAGDQYVSQAVRWEVSGRETFLQALTGQSGSGAFSVNHAGTSVGTAGLDGGGAAS